MERWRVRERVCAVEMFIRTGSITETQGGFHVNGIDMKPNLQMQSVDGYGRGVKKALSRVNSHLVGRPQLAHLTTLPECWLPSAAVRGNLHVSTLKPYACLIGVYDASCVVT